VTESPERAPIDGGASAALPPLDGILETSLYVDDIEQSVAFYRSLFGFPSVYSGPRLTALAVPGRQVLLLFRKKASADLPAIAHDGDGQLHMAFAIPLDALEAWERRLGALRIAIEEKKVWERGGTSLYFRDPDGHLIELATPGLWAHY
jgi:catechol 2,3-dioxygenase-like lactoylglutathione lyase family enzyme